MDAIYAKLTEILSDIVDNDAVVLCETTTADEVDGWDSLANIRFMLTIETTFGVRFSAAEMASFKNVGALANCIEQKSA